MILEDIRKVYELKEQSEKIEDKKLVRKITKLESKIKKKYVKVDINDNLVKYMYVDKENNRVLVTQEDEILLIEYHGSRSTKNFASFLIAYFIILAMAIPVMVIGTFVPEVEFISDAVFIVLNVSAIAVNIVNFVLHKEVILKNKWMLPVMILAIFLNLNGLISLAY